MSVSPNQEIIMRLDLIGVFVVVVTVVVGVVSDVRGLRKSFCWGALFFLFIAPCFVVLTLAAMSGILCLLK